jgi:hypothetical protein
MPLDRLIPPIERFQPELEIRFRHWRRVMVIGNMRNAEEHALDGFLCHAWEERKRGEWASWLSGLSGRSGPSGRGGPFPAPDQGACLRTSSTPSTASTQSTYQRRRYAAPLARWRIISRIASNATGSSRVLRSPVSRPSAAAKIARRRILPDRVLGRARMI